jgi:hypothetical protein
MSSGVRDELNASVANVPPPMKLALVVHPCPGRERSVALVARSAGQLLKLIGLARGLNESSAENHQ